MINKNLLQKMPDALAAAAVIADQMEKQPHITTRKMTTLIMVLWRTSSLMRQGFGTLFTVKFTLKHDGSIPRKIQKMIDRVRLATYIAYMCCIV